ncbi:MAG TPA: hypothetical protein DCK76_11380 [Desulfotomaculum sp.]|nr:hypothetical protein [Desulfotomaculum sp.]HBY04728.1 hypothetical protein [Desulfotomaculum sp.]
MLNCVNNWAFQGTIKQKVIFHLPAWYRITNCFTILNIKRPGDKLVSILRIDKEGTWYADYNPIIHRKISKLFAENLQKDENGGFLVCLGNESMPVEVEETPFVVAEVIPEDGTLRILLADGRDIELPDGPVILIGDVPYITLKWPEDTRVSRSAWWSLTNYLEEADEPEKVIYGQKIWPIIRKKDLIEKQDPHMSM